MTNDNDMSDLQRIAALERSIGKLRRDLASVNAELKQSPNDPEVRKRKGAVEKILFMALAEISRLRKKFRKKLLG